MPSKALRPLCRRPRHTTEGEGMSEGEAWTDERDPFEQHQNEQPQPKRANEGVDAELEIHDAGDIDLAPIPPREWILGARYCIGFVSGNLGDGGVGKTTLALLEALSICTEKSLTGDHVFR